MKFDVFKRELNGYTHRIGTVMADNKMQADNKVRMMFGGNKLEAGETVWATAREMAA